MQERKLLDDRFGSIHEVVERRRHVCFSACRRSGTGHQSDCRIAIPAPQVGASILRPNLRDCEWNVARLPNRSRGNRPQLTAGPCKLLRRHLIETTGLQHVRETFLRGTRDREVGIVRRERPLVLIRANACPHHLSVAGLGHRPSNRVRCRLSRRSPMWPSASSSHC